MKCVLRLGTMGIFRDETLRGVTLLSYPVTSRIQTHTPDIVVCHTVIKLLYYG